MRFVLVKNVGDRDFAQSWNSQQFTIRAQSESMLPFEAVCSWMGNPDARNLGNNRERNREAARIRAKWTDFASMGNPAQYPALEVYTLEGARLYTPAEDPSGAWASSSMSDNPASIALEQLVGALSNQLGPEQATQLGTILQSLVSGSQAAQSGPQAPPAPPFGHPAMAAAAGATTAPTGITPEAAGVAPAPGLTPEQMAARVAAQPPRPAPAFDPQTGLTVAPGQDQAPAPTPGEPPEDKPNRILVSG